MGGLQVQAHVVQSDLDPLNRSQWLEIANGKLVTPPGTEAFMRQVLQPFKVRRHSTRCAWAPAPAPWHARPFSCMRLPGGTVSDGSQNLACWPRCAARFCALPPPSPHVRTACLQCVLVSTKLSSTASRRPMRAGCANGPLRAQSELSVEVPYINAHLDSRQFEILMDIVQSLLASPPPEVRPAPSADAHSQAGMNLTTPPTARPPLPAPCV